MNKKILTIAAVAVVAVGGYFAVNANQPAATEAASENLPAYLQDRVLGEADAPVTVIEYANYTCSHCGDFHRTVYGELKSEFIDTGKVKFIHREVITDGPGILATSLARCLPENQYYGMNDVLYEKQNDWAYTQETIDGVKDELRKYANLAGLSADALNACFDDTAKQEEILEHFRALADADNIKGTPSIYVNGKYVDNWSWENLKPAIEKALN